MKFMKLLLVLLLGASVVAVHGQSLSEAAKKEKERREKNKKEGREVLVVTDENLPAGRVAIEEGEEVPGSQEETASERAETAPTQKKAEEVTLSTPIPLEAPMEERLRLFDAMRGIFERRVVEIDRRIEGNNERLAEIEQELAIAAGSTSVGVPVAPGPSQPLPRFTTGQEVGPLTEERANLQRENGKLEQEKQSLRSGLLEKGRRAGIPAGRLRELR